MVELFDIKNRLSALSVLLKELGDSLNIPYLLKQKEGYDELINSEDFWSNQKSALEIVNKANTIKEKLDQYDLISSRIESAKDLLELIKEEYDEDLHLSLENELLDIEKIISIFETDVLLSGQFDNSNAIVEIHPGAGGTESQDWAEMLYRMYVRYAEKHKFKIQSIDYQVGDEAGIKSVSFIIKGKNAYGYLKSEKGVHRLVRISPFDSSGRRHTSFASVEVTPETSGTIDIEILDKDLKIDTYRSSGAGGQNVNKTESAVRITHIPTGIVVACQNERSQIQNREIAMNILKSRLILLKEMEKQQELAKLRGEQKNIEWGSQIRSYVFCPYTMVKDHRSSFETGDVSGVMDGDIDGFITSYLKWEVKNGLE